MRYLAFVLCLVVTASAYTPKFKWSQSKTKLSLSLEVACKDSITLKFGPDTIDFSCQSETGTAELQGVFREDINGAESECVKGRHAVNCYISKSLEHRWDRLFFDSEAFKSQMSIDWTRFDEDIEDKDDADSDHAEFYSSSSVRTLTEDRYEEARAKKSMLVLDVNYPWCSKCDHVRTTFKDTAKEYKDEKDEIMFAYVDPLENRSLRRLFQPNCSFECHIFVVKQDEKDFTKLVYSSDLKSKLEALKWPLVRNLKSEKELDALLEEQDIVVVGVVDKDNNNLMPKLKAVAKDNRQEAVFAVDDSDIVSLDGTSKPAVVLYRKSDGKRAITTDFSDLQAWFESNRFPFSFKFDWETKTKMDKLEQPLAYLFLHNDVSETQLNEYIDGLSEYQGKINVMHVDESNHFLMDSFGLNKEDVPAFGISATPNDGSEKFGLVLDEDQDLTLDAMRAHVQGFFDGNLPTTKRSERPIKDQPENEARKVVWRSLATEIKDTSDAVFLAVYAQWSEKWPKTSKVMNQLAKCVSGIEGVRIASYDTSKNHLEEELFPNKGDDDKIKFYFYNGPAGDKTITPYTGKKTRRDFLKFLKKNVAGVAENWEKVQATVEEFRAEAKAAKEAEEAARKAAEAEFENFPKVDITEDGGIVKHVKEDGEGESPLNGAKIKAHYTGRLLDGTVFDSSVDRGTPFDFTLGKGQVIKCWDQGFATMKKGEKAFLTCTSDYAYGKSGSGKIPADATLRFEVELLEFTNPDHDEL